MEYYISNYIDHWIDYCEYMLIQLQIYKVSFSQL
jgi:hypothetical protein